MVSTDQQRPPEDVQEQVIYKKLNSSILRRIEGARCVRKTPDFVVFTIYRWGGELLLLLAAIGLSHPTTEVISAASAAPSTAPPEAKGGLETALASIRDYSPLLSWTLIGLLVAWFTIKLWVNTNRLIERGPLMAACIRELEGLNGDLETALQTQNPIEEIGNLLNKSKDIVDRYYRIGAWPWPIGPDNIDSQLNDRATLLFNRYRMFWTAQCASNGG